MNKELWNDFKFNKPYRGENITTINNVTLPQEYLDFMYKYNGGQNKILTLYPLEDLQEINEEEGMSEYLPRHVIIGANREGLWYGINSKGKYFSVSVKKEKAKLDILGANLDEFYRAVKRKSSVPKKTGLFYRIGYAGWALFYCLLFLVFFAGIVVLIYPTPEWFVEKADTHILLLEGYQKSWWLKGILSYGAVAVIVVGGIIAYILQSKTERKRELDKAYKDVIQFYRKRRIRPKVVILPLAAFGGFGLIVLLGLLKPFEEYRLYQEDVIAIQEGKLQESVVRVYPDYKETGLDRYLEALMFGYEMPKIVVKYETSDEDVYVPVFMDFTLDGLENNNPNDDRAWSRENSAIYHVTYTPNYHLITEIEMVEQAE